MEFKKIGYKWLSEYIHGYNVPGLHSFIFSYKDFLLDVYNEGIEKANKSKQANVMVPMENTFHIKVTSLLTALIKKYYVIGNNYSNSKPIGVYIQNNKNNVAIFHNHISQSSLTCTLYLDPIIDKKEGGEIEFMHPPNTNYLLNPLKDWVYFFPGWMYHRPLPQIRQSPRICLNWGIDTENRVIHKISHEKI